MAPPKSSRSEDDIEKLITKVCTNFTAQLEQKFDSKWEKMDKKLSDVCSTLKNLNINVNNNTKAITEIQDKVDGLEQRFKRNTLRFCGLDEDNEDLTNVVSEFIKEKLEIPCSPMEIDCAFRLGKESDEEVRTVVVNFVRNSKRNEVFYSKNKLKDTSFVIYEDLTHSRYELLSAAKKKYGKSKAWSSNGKIYVLNHSGKKKAINTMADLK